MSGVNAHMLLCTCDPDPHATANVPALVWEPRRAWPGPFMHRFANPVAAGFNASRARSAACCSRPPPLTKLCSLKLSQGFPLCMVRRLATDMTAPALAFLWDHHVARRVLLAAAAMLETAVAGIHAMLESRADRTPLLEHVSFSRPVVLGETQSRCVFALPHARCAGQVKRGLTTGSAVQHSQSCHPLLVGLRVWQAGALEHGHAAIPLCALHLCMSLCICGIARWAASANAAELCARAPGLATAHICIECSACSTLSR